MTMMLQTFLFALLVTASFTWHEALTLGWRNRLRNSNSEEDKLFRLEIECSYKRVKEVIKCRSKSDPVNTPSCPAIAYGLPNDVRTYAIGTLRASPGPNPDTWFRMYPKKSDNQGWWDYKNYEKPGSAFLLHSKRKHSSKSTGILVLEPVCWESVYKLLRFSRNSEYFSIDRSRSTNRTNKAPILGILNID